MSGVGFEYDLLQLSFWIRVSGVYQHGGTVQITGALTHFGTGVKLEVFCDAIGCVNDFPPCPLDSTQRGQVLNLGMFDIQHSLLPEVQHIFHQSATVYLSPGNATVQEGIPMHYLSYLEIAAHVLEQLSDAELLDQDGLELLPDAFITSFTSDRTYSGFQRDAVSLRHWLVHSLPTSVFSITDFNFADVVLKSTTPWVVDFYAPWCGPCQTFAVEFELVAKQLDAVADGRRVKFAKVNCDQFPRTCQLAAIHAYPTVRFYPGRTGWAAQNPAGIQMVTERRKAKDVAERLEDLPAQYQPSGSAGSYAERHKLLVEFKLIFQT